MEKHKVKIGRPLEVTFLEIALETEHFEKIKQRTDIKDGVEYNDVVIRVDDKTRRFTFQNFCSRLGMGKDPMNFEVRKKEKTRGEPIAICKERGCEALDFNYGKGNFNYTTV